MECGSGALTKFNRAQQGIEKAHWLDAACVGKSTPALCLRGVQPLFIKSYEAAGSIPGYRLVAFSDVAASSKGLTHATADELRARFGLDGASLAKTVKEGWD